LLYSLDRPLQQAEAQTEASVHSSEKTVSPVSESGVSNEVIKQTGVGQSTQLKTEDKVKLSFVGDIILSSRVEELLKTNGFEYPYKYVKSYLEKADIAVGNLESPFTTRGTPQEKEYVFRSPPEALPDLKKAGFDIFNLANNHILDYGQEGLLDTFDYLDAQQLKRVGAGRNVDEAFRPAIVQHNGMKVAFLGFSRVIPNTSWYAGKSRPGVAETYDPKPATEAIAKARSEADLVVVLAHWGQERKDRPVKEQVDLAHKYIDSGADLVIASHPHVLQGFEQYKGKWIAYSLGNFIFTTNDVPETWESMILEASCTKMGSCELHMVPMITKWAQPIRMVEDLGQKLFEKLTRLSYNAKVDSQGNITEGPVNEGFLTTPPAALPKLLPDTNANSALKGGGTVKPSTKPSTTPSTAPSGTKSPASGTQPSGNTSKTKPSADTTKKTEPSKSSTSTTSATKPSSTTKQDSTR
jgi:poly-gamma-glutamate capsule biosynthesis protein CapA/YwtB (metallophosphatase superfamily)